MGISATEIGNALNAGVAAGRATSGGKNASYIPFLASVPAGLFGLAVFAAPALFAIAAPAAPAGDIAAGRQLYAEKGCAACHGPGGEGAAAGPRVAGAAMDWPAYHAQIRAPRGAMPPYGPGLMSDRQVADTYAYLKSLAAPKPSPVAQLKGDRVAGRKTYLENGCHA